MSKKTIILLIVILAVVVGFGFFRIFRDIRISGPAESAVLKEPKTIGSILIRQQLQTVEGVKRGLKDLGYKRISYKEELFTLGPTAQADAQAAVRKMIAEGVDLLFIPSEITAKDIRLVMQELKSDIPVVFLAQFHDPVSYGIVQSFQSSGNNLTGIASQLTDVIGKQLEFIKKINPAGKKIGVFSDGFMIPNVGEEMYAQLKALAPKLGFQLVEYKTTTAPPGAESAWRKIASGIKAGDIDAIYHIPGHFFDAQETSEAELANRLGVPHVAPIEDLPTGGHFAYSSDYFTAGKQMARLVDKIFKGEKPTDIPIEFTQKNSLILHIGRADKDGLTFPESMLSIADEKIGK
ncbi:MAG: ABC transporter substrate-binding protein [Candidatus Niyogibacteria bacterium]|nr:MAG: ABC transporter substrate-binding protein [Candidatus Niyogibacteria bacterium]